MASGRAGLSVPTARSPAPRGPPPGVGAGAPHGLSLQAYSRPLRRNSRSHRGGHPWESSLRRRRRGRLQEGRLRAGRAAAGDPGAPPPGSRAPGRPFRACSAHPPLICPSPPRGRALPQTAPTRVLSRKRLRPHTALGTAAQARLLPAGVCLPRPARKGQSPLRAGACAPRPPWVPEAASTLSPGYIVLSPMCTYL